MYVYLLVMVTIYYSSFRHRQIKLYWYLLPNQWIQYYNIIKWLAVKQWIAVYASMHNLNWYTAKGQGGKVISINAMHATCKMQPPKWHLFFKLLLLYSIILKIDTCGKDLFLYFICQDLKFLHVLSYLSGYFKVYYTIDSYDYINVW